MLRLDLESGTLDDAPTLYCTCIGNDLVDGCEKGEVSKVT